MRVARPLPLMIVIASSLWRRRRGSLSSRCQPSRRKSASLCAGATQPRNQPAGIARPRSPHAISWANCRRGAGLTSPNWQVQCGVGDMAVTSSAVVISVNSCPPSSRGLSGPRAPFRPLSLHERGPGPRVVLKSAVAVVPVVTSFSGGRRRRGERRAAHRAAFAWATCGV
jgi:hypothetical protein